MARAVPVKSMTGPIIFLDGPFCYLVVWPMIAFGFEAQTLVFVKEYIRNGNRASFAQICNTDVLFSLLGCIISTDGV